MEVKLTFRWELDEERDRRGHLQKGVSDEFEACVVLSHTPLKLYLFGTMLFGVIRVFSHSFEGKLGTNC